ELDVDVEAVQKNAVQGVPGDLRDRGIQTAAHARRIDMPGLTGGAHYQHAVCAQMQRGADRRDLAHRPVAEIFPVDFHRGKYERQGRRSHQMLDPDRHRRADALRALPGFGVGPSLVEGDALPGGVPRAGDRDRVQVAVVDVFLDATDVEAA